MVNYKLLSFALAALIISTVIVGVASAKWTNNGNGTWTLSYDFTTEQQDEIEEAFSTMYPSQFEAANVTKKAFANQQVKNYIQEVRQSYRAEMARRAINTTAVSDFN